MTKRHVPPSRVRYEKKNPVVTFRVPAETRLKIEELRAKTGKSLSRLLQEGLGLVETRTEEAYKRGLRDGQGRFEAPCKYCGKPMQLDIKTGEGVREAVLEAFSDWIHDECERSQ